MQTKRRKTEFLEEVEALYKRFEEHHAKTAMPAKKQLPRKESVEKVFTIPQARAIFLAGKGGLVYQLYAHAESGYWRLKKFPRRKATQPKVMEEIVNDLIEQGFLLREKGNAVLSEAGENAFNDIVMRKDLYEILRATKSNCLRLGVEPRGGWATLE